MSPAASATAPTRKADRKAEAWWAKVDIRLKVAIGALTLAAFFGKPALDLYAQVQRQEVVIRRHEQLPGHSGTQQELLGVRDRLTRVETVVTELKGQIRELVIELRRRR